MNNQQRIRVLLLLTWMAVIFLYSARPADISTKDSHVIGNMIVDVVRRVGQEEWTDQKQQLFVEDIDFYVRKAAHMGEYAVLGVLLMGCLQSFGVAMPRLWQYALAAGVLYAASDEFHQFFVPGRACQLRDVWIDGVGVVLGVIIFTSIFCKRH